MIGAASHGAWSVRDRLELLSRPAVTVAGRAISSFQICGVVGFGAAVAAALALAARLGLSVALLVALAGAAVVTFLAVALVTRALAGEERLVYYHHELAVLAVTGATIAVLRRPVLAHLDVVVVALGVFLGCGRVGCWMVGCCHGRPHRLGLRYRAEHADRGFSRWLVGVPLLPVQAFESLAVLALTGRAAARLWAGDAPPGAVLASQLTGYALLRFLLELARGDGARASWAGVSEAQWISAALALAVAGAERAGWLPSSPFHLGLAAALVAALCALLIWRRRSGSPHRLLEPDHVAEVAQAVADQRGPGAVRVYTTSLGVRISTGGDGTDVRFYTLSGIGAAGASALASLILLLRPPAAGPVRRALIEARPGLFHLVFTGQSGQTGRDDVAVVGAGSP